MIKTVYIFLITFFSVLAELLFRNIGLFFPFCGLFIFYVTTAFGVRYGFLAAFLAACPLDFLGNGAAHPWSMISFSAVIGLSCFWLHRVESESLFLHSLPGAAVPGIIWIFSLLFFSESPGMVFLDHFPSFLPACFFSALFLPLEIYFFDTLNERLSLPLYTNAKLDLK
ncbi:MAG: hypothetical protein J6W81_05955 [Lentisphaeria bacterium]|nr:hypothetical protein [Lentisphaeria bacterium]MBO7328453.1 hypothetical protein [Lentisphaeria bacterium]